MFVNVFVQVTCGENREQSCGSEEDTCILYSNMSVKVESILHQRSQAMVDNAKTSTPASLLGLRAPTTTLSETQIATARRGPRACSCEQDQDDKLSLKAPHPRNAASQAPRLASSTNHRDHVAPQPMPTNQHTHLSLPEQTFEDAPILTFSSAPKPKTVVTRCRDNEDWQANHKDSGRTVGCGTSDVEQQLLTPT